MDDQCKEISQLHLTMGLECNARCVMCYQRDSSARYNMPSVIYREHLAPLYPHISEVIIQGGEPTIMPNCRDFALFLQRFPDIRLQIVTNGIRVDGFWSEVFTKQSSLVNYSINAATSDVYDKIVQSGDFNAVIGNIRKTVSARVGRSPVVSISAVLLKRNMHQVADIIALAHELGVDSVYFTVDPLLSFKGVGSSRQIRSELEKALRVMEGAQISVSGLDIVARRFKFPWSAQKNDDAKKPCRAPFSSLWVGQDGEVRVCCGSWRKIGNTYHTSISDILNSPERRAFQEKIGRGEYSWCSAECKDNLSPSNKAFFDRGLYLLCNHPVQLAATVKNKLSRMIWI